jgi:hypothetical protein
MVSPEPRNRRSIIDYGVTGTQDITALALDSVHLLRNGLIEYCVVKIGLDESMTFVYA